MNRLSYFFTVPKGNEAAELIEKVLASGADVNDQSRNGHRPLQLLIRAQIDQRLKIQLIKQLIELGADVNFADNSGLTPFQTAVAEGNREISFLMTKRISIRSYRKPDTLYSPLDLVVCEGETERDYFCELARVLRIHAHICKGDGTDPKSIVNTAKRKAKEDGVKYDQIFCVFDRDNQSSAFIEVVEQPKWILQECECRK